MKKYSVFLISVCGLFLAAGCSGDANSPIENDSSAPAPVYNPVVENLPGAARITYSLPADKDLLYVLARYVNEKGETRDFRSSYYTNSVIVEGFGRTGDYPVTLYAVDRSENRSEPVQVTVSPTTPPVMRTAGSLDIKPDFGGISFTFRNETKADLAIMVCTPDETGEMVTAETFYTARDSAKFAVRGYEPELRTFGIVVRDRWENLSDTVYCEVTPVYEVMLDKSRFRAVSLPTDSPADFWSGSLEYMWDGVNNGDRAAHTGNMASGAPKYFTFDMGVEAKLSRFNLQTTADDKHLFNDVSPRLYEVWGCLDPDPSGGFDGWTKLVTIENIKPSGLPAGILTEDDRVAGRHGDDADIPSEMPKVRYIRIRCLNNWSGNTNMVVNEVTLWGNDR